MVKRSKTPISEEEFQKHIIRPGRKPESKTEEADPLIKAIKEYTPAVSLRLDPPGLSYGKVCEAFGISITGGALEKNTGCYYKANYNAAKRGEIKVSPGSMIAACLLSRLTVQKTIDAFHACKDVHDLPEYGYDAAVLLYFLADYHNNGNIHDYEDLVKTTIRLNFYAEIMELPFRYRKNKVWRNTFEKIKKDYEKDKSKG